MSSDTSWLYCFQSYFTSRSILDIFMRSHLRFSRTIFLRSEIAENQLQKLFTGLKGLIKSELPLSLQSSLNHFIAPVLLVCSQSLISLHNDARLYIYIF